jgi:hypothetical protein
MGWEKDWLAWTHVTYGILQSVRLAERIDLGNLTRLQDNIAGTSQWCVSALGFESVAPARSMSPGSIKVNPEEATRLLGLLRPAVLQTLLLTTVTLTEGILCDLLAQAGVSRPPSLAVALDILNTSLRQNARHQTNGWAIEAMHEARILRNCIAHASGKWSAEGVQQYQTQFPNALILPVSGQAFTISLDNVFAYRRAAKTVLNEAARLSRSAIAVQAPRKRSTRTR